MPKPIGTRAGVRNILATYYRAGPLELDAGREWYTQAWRIADTLAATYGVPIPRAVGALAALSPGVSWTENVAAAETYCQAFRDDPEQAPPIVPGYQLNRTKAWAILSGHYPHPRTAFETGTAPKTLAFYDAISGDRNAVCVDGHAVSIREGVRFPVGDPRAKLWAAKYSRVAADYRKAAAIVGEDPRDLQAITWVTWHKLHSITGESLQISFPF